MTCLFITYDLAVVRYISERIAVMYLGKIVESAPSRDLFIRPRHPYTEALISAVPVPDPRYRTKRVPLRGDVPSPLNPPTGCAFHPRCPYAAAICQYEGPPHIHFGEHQEVRCHLAEQLTLRPVGGE